MSYSVNVYAKKAFSLDQLQALFSERGYAVEIVDDTHLVCETDGGVSVHGPLRVQPDDVPVEILTFGAFKYCYEFTYRNDFGSELVRVLADDVDAAVYDGEVLRTPLSGVPRATRPVKDELVETLKLVWYGYSGAQSDPLMAWWESARRWFPEASPRRFGEWEPLQGMVSEVGFDGLQRAWRDARQPSLLFTCAQLPAIEADLTTPTGMAAVRDGAWSLRLSLLAEPISDVARRGRLERFFVSVAEASGAVYATGQVTGGWIWSGRKLWGNGKTERAFSSWTQYGGFAGLAPMPMWWSWFGGPYRPLLEGSLRRAERAGRVEQGDGVFVSLSESPTGNARLSSGIGGLFVPGVWYPRFLCAGAPLTKSGNVRPAVRRPRRDQ
jgi:hypothetical protein